MTHTGRFIFMIRKFGMKIFKSLIFFTRGSLSKPFLFYRIVVKLRKKLYISTRTGRKYVHVVISRFFQVDQRGSVLGLIKDDQTRLESIQIACFIMHNFVSWHLDHLQFSCHKRVRHFFSVYIWRSFKFIIESQVVGMRPCLINVTVNGFNSL